MNQLILGLSRRVLPSSVLKTPGSSAKKQWKRDRARGCRRDGSIPRNRSSRPPRFFITCSDRTYRRCYRNPTSLLRFHRPNLLTSAGRSGWRRYLDRAAEAGGLQYFLGKIQAGASLAEVAGSLFALGEYFKVLLLEEQRLSR